MNSQCQTNSPADEVEGIGAGSGQQQTHLGGPLVHQRQHVLPVWGVWGVWGVEVGEVRVGCETRRIVKSNEQSCNDNYL